MDIHSVTTIVGCYKCGQIGRFLKALSSKFSFKSSPNVRWLYGQTIKPLLFKSNYIYYFLGNFWKNWATFCSNIWSHWASYSSACDVEYRWKSHNDQKDTKMFFDFQGTDAEQFLKKHGRMRQPVQAPTQQKVILLLAIWIKWIVGQNMRQLIVLPHPPQTSLA